MLVYSICYYYGKNKTANIINHIKSFKLIRKDVDIFILTVMIDSHNKKDHDNIIDDLTNIINKENSDLNFKILTSFNWGGTILGLWEVFKFIKITYDKNTYLSYFEEDFCPFNNEWLEDSKELLNLNKNYIYIGESTNEHNIRPKEGKIKQSTSEQIMPKYMIPLLLRDSTSNIHFSVCGHDDVNKDNCCADSCNLSIRNYSVWTDGGYYFSTIEKLLEIEKHIGIFHKGNPETKYDHDMDGVYFGECGLPSLLYHTGFNFGALYRYRYFKHYI